MSSSDEDVPSVNKRRRLLGSYREEQDSSASPAYDRHGHSSGGAPGRYSETYDLKAAAAAGHSHHGMSNAEPLPARYTEGAAEQQDFPPGEAASLLQRVQRESESLQGTIGRGLASLLGGDINHQPTSQQELPPLQDQRRTSEIMFEHMRSSGLLRGADANLLPPTRVDSSRASLPFGTSTTPSAYEQYLTGDQVPSRQQEASLEIQRYDALLMGRARDLLDPSLAHQFPHYGASASASSDYYQSNALYGVARMPPHARDIESLLPPFYNQALTERRTVFPGDPYLDTFRSDSLLAQRYPLTTAALGDGLGLPQLGVEFERARIRQEVMREHGFINNVTARANMAQPPQPAQANLDHLAPVVRRNRNPITLHRAEDEESLSSYQCAVRKQIEVFAAEPLDVDNNAQGRNKAIILNQVGIRCIHCADIHPKRRARGGTYYPSTLNGFYQAAQNMATGHLCEYCTHVPLEVRQRLLILKTRKSSAGGGKEYWAKTLQALGVVEDKEKRILRFKDNGDEEDSNAGDDEEKTHAV